MDQPPLFGGEAGEPVPQVDPEDVKAIWKLGKDVQRRHPGEHVGIDVQVLEQTWKAEQLANRSERLQGRGEGTPGSQETLEPQRRGRK